MNINGDSESGKAEVCGANAPPVRPMHLVIAGAGTGGHLFPGIAVAEELMRRSPESRVLFITTGRPVEKTVLEEKPFETAAITAAGFKGMSLWRKLAAFKVLPRGLFQSMGLLRKFSPDAVLGMGAYSSAPVVIGACLKGIPRFIHEQNRIAGITNKWLSGFADKVFVSFEDTDMGCRADKIVYTGNPVRAGIRGCLRAGIKSRQRGNEEPFTILVLGGSQGAHSINTAVTEAFSRIENTRNFKVIHQTGAKDEQYVRRAYESMGVNATVASFFNDMASLYESADLAVCRAGASTVAEIAAVGLPALFIPFPHAADDHQAANAEGLAAAGAAEIIDERNLSGGVLAGRFEAYRADPAEFEKLKASAAAAGMPDSASVILDQITAAVPAKK
ncbi:MAG: undecaprenyldiphospho-muramoylpentapeptide beta-N-acetylglucosaminyltransferase [Desulfobacteraceae bacterium]|nr:undecaprenyldiphospho-muramoylpentapeptide beta-N-acetylglucosaminyltransferase [Desulfobacteraceae bacterium]